MVIVICNQVTNVKKTYFSVMKSAYKCSIEIIEK